ncbi:MAG: J domain-containing protein [Deltaproteobacteria bacterium]|nr:J domain-containing protein [Deltaproteobacteria bacterium]
MTRKDWKKIVAARDLLGLAEKATLAEIKRAYRRMSKKHHPDMAASRPGDEQPVAMHEITTAYQLLLAYCRDYRFPLVMQQDSLDPEDWWFDRFGQDPLWGKQREE